MITMQINGVIYQTELEAVDVNVGGEWLSETIPVIQRDMMHDKNKYYMVAECISYAYTDAHATSGTAGEFSYQMLLNDRPATYAQIKQSIYGA